MKEIILIRGPLGIGKSTISVKLADELKAAYISIDQVLEDLGLDQAEDEGIPLKNFLAANKHVFPSIMHELKSNRGVVIDGNFYHKEQIDDFASHFGQRLRVFTLVAPVEVCIERDKGRKRSYGEDSARFVHAMVSRFDAGIVIHMEHKSIVEVTEEILQQINEETAYLLSSANNRKHLKESIQEAKIGKTICVKF